GAHELRSARVRTDSITFDDDRLFRHKGFLKDCPDGLLTEQIHDANSRFTATFFGLNIRYYNHSFTNLINCTKEE
ncbi:unnamed protein product, partial [Heterotrigona itama]